MEVNQENMSQEQMLEQQKKQCIFCQIIAGNQPAAKVYEDDKIIAILDIRPASKGHVLVMPKEHYPFLPLLPPELKTHIFQKIKEISIAMFHALLVEGMNIFVANGQVAGQQAQHFMVHLIPRDENDGITVFDLPETTITEAKMQELRKLLAVKSGEQVPKLTKEQLVKIINSNPQLKQIVEEHPHEFKKIVAQTPQLKQLFEGQDLEAIIALFKKKEPTIKIETQLGDIEKILTPTQEQEKKGKEKKGTEEETSSSEEPKKEEKKKEATEETSSSEPQKRKVSEAKEEDKPVDLDKIAKLLG